MKKYTIILILIIATTSLSAQMKPYITSGGEIIFSFAKIDHNSIEGDNIMRWSPVFNSQNYLNMDFAKSFGMITGLNIRNVGFIDNAYDPDNSGMKKKFRTYNLGIPIGFKIGNLNNFFLFGGYEIEFPFHYKEKTFINGDKQDNKITGWFSSRVPTYYNTVFGGIQLPYGLTFKVKYYFTGFFNKDFTETVNGQEIKPYENYNVNIIYFSLSFSLFKGDTFYFKEVQKQKNTEIIY